MRDRRIVIIGFMGCGKTTVARELALQLACDFTDLDSFITQREGRSPADIIEEDGEPHFREVETRALRDVLQNHDADVVALGGGTWTVSANRSLITDHDCSTIWLDAPFELCWQRIVTSSNTVRPLAPDHETARNRYQSRVESYKLAEGRITLTESDTPETIVTELLRQS
jgi:shikimate kinase